MRFGHQGPANWPPIRCWPRARDAPGSILGCEGRPAWSTGVRPSTAVPASIFTVLFQLRPQGQGHGCGVQIAFEWAGDGAGKPLQTRRLRVLGDGKRRGAQHRSERFVQHGEGGRGPTKVFWVGEGLCGPAGPVLKCLIATRSAKQLQAFPALSDQGDGAVQSEGFPVFQQFRRAAKAREPGVPRRGTRGRPGRPQGPSIAVAGPSGAGHSCPRCPHRRPRRRSWSTPWSPNAVSR